MGGHVRYDLGGAVATLTLDRPERLNAIVPELIDDLEAALDRAEGDDAVRVIRLRGAGRAFCACYDIEWGARMMEEAEGDRPGEGVAFTRAAIEDVRRAVAERDAPFGDYGREPR